MTEKELSPAAMALVAKEAELDAKRRALEAETASIIRVRDQIRDAIAYEMGDADTGIFQGQIVMRKVATAQFAKAQFAKAHPTIWDEVKVPKLTYDVDTDKLKEIDEDLYNQFRTTRWYNDTGV